MLITDGGDNASHHHTNEAIRSMEMPSSPFVYVLEILDPYAPTPEERMPAMDFFPSAGMLILRANPSEDFSTRVAEIAQCIDHQYALSYRSTLTTPDKRFHKIEVKAPGAEDRIKIESLPGYYIPSR